MLSIHKIESAENAKHYFEKDNYYTKDGALQNSYWYGKASRQLGLSDHIHSDDFFSLLDGHFESDRLGRSINGEHEHTPGWDCTFSAPKSVSILAEAAGISAVKDAHTRAVKKALDYIESVASVTRVMENNESNQITTGKLCFAAFTHDTSRELDPQLHTHCVVMNGTKTHKGWRSLSSRELYRIKMLAGQYYRNELACHLKKQGYSIRPAGKHGLFEIDGMTDDMIKHFSVRRQQIENYLAEHNLAPTPANSELATLKTRKNKTDVDRNTLHELWRDRLVSLGINHEALINDLLITPPNSRTVVRRTLRLLSEHQMSFSEQDILRTCFTADLGNASSRAVITEIERLKSIKLLLEADNGLLTTQKGKRLEHSILANLHSTQQQFRPIINKALGDPVLNDDQLNAVNTCLLSRDQFIGLQGSAGTGKTMALSVLHRTLLAKGYEVTAIAPTHTAVKEVTSSIKCQSCTVDAVLLKKFQKSKTRPEFWLVDESSFLSARKIERIQNLAIRQNARVLFIGDHAQLESIEAGRAFRQLQDAGMDTAVMSKIMRQQDEQLFDAVTHVVNDEYSQAIDKIDSSIHVINSDSERIEAMVEQWLDYDQAERDDVLMLAPSHKERSIANQLAHHALIERGEIAQQSLSINTLTNRQISNVESRSSASYLIGDSLRFSRDYKQTTKKHDDSIAKNDYYEVIGIHQGKNQLILQSRQSKQRFALNPAKRGGNRIGGINVFSENTTAINIGEKIRWTDNNNPIGLKRNHCLTISAINNEKIIATDESDKEITIDTTDMNQRHLTYNYANTIYAAQGKTCNHVLALAHSEQLNLVNRKSFYVTISRARHSASIFTNDKSKLKTAIGERFGQNTIALKTRKVAELRVKAQSRSLNYLI